MYIVLEFMAVTLMVATVRQRAERTVTWALLIAPVVALLVLSWSRRWMSDDGFINLRVVEQLLAGNGPVFNAGERVEIATSPLWVVILTAGSAVSPWMPLAWKAVILGIATTGLGLVAAEAGALRMWAGDRPAGRAVPLGVLVVVALPPFWDFASSGLETGLSLAWIGGCWYLLTGETSARHWVTAVLCGLGPLVRPDLAIFSAVFLVVLLLVPRPHPIWSRLGTLVAAGLLPGLWQVFRMGYYGALVPNTAFAKEASLARWDQGWLYLGEFTTTYRIAIPLVALLITLIVPRAARSFALGHRYHGALLIAPVAGAALHWLYVVRVGGDFMHARLLLPGLFASLLPVAIVDLPQVRSGRLLRGVASTGPLLVVATWALLVGIAVRVDHDGIGPDGIVDERSSYVESAGHPNPVTFDDHARNSWVEYARTAREQAENDRPVLIVGEAGFEDPTRWVALEDDRWRPVVAYPNVGLLAYGSGVGVHIVDQLGLGDALTARQRLEARGRPGHEKTLDPAWVFARFADASETTALGAPPPPAVAAARRALRCGEIAQILVAVQQPLTVSRFVDNLGVAVRLHGARWPADPVAASRKLCRPGISP